MDNEDKNQSDEVGGKTNNGPEADEALLSSSSGSSSSDESSSGVELTDEELSDEAPQEDSFSGCLAPASLGLSLGFDLLSKTASDIYTEGSVQLTTLWNSSKQTANQGVIMLNQGLDALDQAAADFVKTIDDALEGEPEEQEPPASPSDVDQAQEADEPVAALADKDEAHAAQSQTSEEKSKRPKVE